jgi:ferredoxin-type protein NapG
MMDRRTFVTKFPMAVGVAGFCSMPFAIARLLAPGMAEAAESRIPLPGALAPHSEFINACIGCGVCAEVCPPRCIRFHMNDGGKEANTPYIDPAARGCILCGLCMKACPTEALTITPIRDVKMGIAQIDQSACYPWVNISLCGACYNICPLGSVAIRPEVRSGNRTAVPVVQNGCVGCGLCVDICPKPNRPIKIVDYSLSTKKYTGKNSEKYKVKPEPEQVNSATGELKY